MIPCFSSICIFLAHRVLIMIIYSKFTNAIIFLNLFMRKLLIIIHIKWLNTNISFSTVIILIRGFQE